MGAKLQSLVAHAYTNFARTVAGESDIGSMGPGYFMVTRRYRKTLRLSVIASCQDCIRDFKLRIGVFSNGGIALAVTWLAAASIIALGIGSCIV